MHLQADQDAADLRRLTRVALTRIENLSADTAGRVYWLGGASGAGKSTIARRLAAAHGMTLYSTDDAMAAHARRCRPEDCPLLDAFARMTMDERWVLQSPREMLDTFHWFHGEAFHPIVEDLAVLAVDKRVIAEGFRLLPRLVRPFLTTPQRALWLIPTAEFRILAFKSRGTLWDIPNKTSDPTVALRNLLARDDLFAQKLSQEVADCGLPSIVVDGRQSEDQLLAATEAHFGLPA